MNFEETNTQDKGGVMEIINIHKETLLNNFYRKAIWTGEHLQVTVMSIPPGGEIGLEIHNDTDQMLKVEYGVASVYMGKTKQDISFFGKANINNAILIPKGTYHNVINEQNMPLKLYSIYAPPHHPIGVIHKTKFDSDVSED